jgi:hypothetical protein
MERHASAYPGVVVSSSGEEKGAGAGGGGVCRGPRGGPAAAEGASKQWLRSGLVYKPKVLDQQAAVARPPGARRPAFRELRDRWGSWRQGAREKQANAWLGGRLCVLGVPSQPKKDRISICPEAVAGKRGSAQKQSHALGPSPAVKFETRCSLGGRVGPCNMRWGCRRRGPVARLGAVGGRGVCVCVRRCRPVQRE